MNNNFNTNKTLKLVFLFSIVFITIGILLCKQSQNDFNVEKYSEFVKNKYSLSFDFIDKDEACDKFITHHKEYFNRLQSHESVARNCINNILEYDSKTISYKCQTLYCNNTMNFTNVEKEQLQYVVKLTEKALNKNIHKGILGIKDNFNFKKYLGNWKFIKVSNSIENELPHTIDKYIVLSESFLGHLNDLIANDDKNILIKDIGATLLHEQIHILQRNNEKLFDTLYSNYWNFKKLYNIPTFEYIKEKQRLNPDGMDLDWGFQIALDTYLIPIVLLKDNINSLDFFDKYGLVVKHDKIIKREKLNNFGNYVNYFCGISNNYHPNELSASLISEYLLNNYFNHNKECKSIKNMVHWINSKFT
jgi:hypothetical protein